MNKKDKIFVSLIALGSVLLAYLLYPKFLGDDTFIHIGFIKDIISGKGFSFTGTKTYGTTSPLWVLLGAFFSKLFFSPEFSVRLLSGLFGFCTVLLFYLVLKQKKIERAIIFPALISLAFNPFFLRWELSGMEVTAAMFSFLLIYYLFDIDNSKVNWTAGGFIFGLAILLRPEFLGFFAIFVLYYFFTVKNRRKDLSLSSLITIFIFSGWLLFSYNYFGTIVPNTYLSKVTGSLFHPEFDHAFRSIKLFAAGNFPEFTIMFIASIFFIILRKGTQSNKKVLNYLYLVLHQTDIILPVLWTSGFYIFYILKDVAIISRYSLMLVPFIILIAAALLNHFHQSANTKTFRFVIINYIALIFISYGLITFAVVKPASDAFVNGFQKTYKDIAGIIRKDSGGEHKTVAVTDVGIIGCYSGARVYDFAGLVDQTRFNYKSSHDYLLAKKPNYLILREELKPDDILPKNVTTEILFKRKIAGFGINHTKPRTVTLYKLGWN